MVRPCFLVVDQEHSGSISTRKLVIETAKFNVITAYSGGEAVETLRTFPGIHGAVLDAGLKDLPCGDLIGQLKNLKPQLSIIVVGRPGKWNCDGADHYLASFEPKRLLDLLQKLEPEQTARIARKNEELAG